MSMQKTILIVEKSDYAALKMTEYLRTAGCETIRAKSGQLGIGAIRSKQPDLILLSDDLNDLDARTFMDRMRNMLGKVSIPVILLTKGNGKAAAEKIKIRPDEAVDGMERPVVLDKLYALISDHLQIPTARDTRHLNSEVFIRDGVVIIELRGYLTQLNLVALKYRILDIALADKTLTKRFYLIIYELEEDGLSQESFSRIFDFVTFFKDTPPENFKILTSSETIKQFIKQVSAASRFEIVDNYIEGLNKLKSLYLKEGTEEIRLEFLQPDSVLFKDVYDSRGNRVKERGKSFTQQELDALIKKGVTSLYYTRRARVDNDRQIIADEDVDVVLDAIHLTGVMIPEQFMDYESKKRLKVNILIVNSDLQELESLVGFFTSHGFPVKKATSVTDALKRAAAAVYDYMIVDLELEDGRGLDLVRAIRKLDTLKSCNFIITGKSVRADVVKEAVSLGVNGFLKSPVDVEKLQKLFQ
jgi:DNA-binding response OmpR family regulator